MTGITAVIVAAGMGIRMGPLGKMVPKGMLPMGGETLISQSLASLRAFGVPKIRIVTGHLADHFQSAHGSDADVELVHNPAYAVTGSLLSLLTGLKDLSGPCLVLESDLVYAPQALAAALDGETRLLTSGPTRAGDEVYVWTGPGKHLAAISKDLSVRPEPPYGELVGITRLSAEAVEALREVGPRVLARVPDEHYEAGIVELGRELPVEVFRIDDLPWAEVDNLSMLERAERVVYPWIVEARKEITSPA
ncbi:NTP transferase domain-containing protein [Pseudoruegeria sp. HB172150]|uniref:phosphocholine cytidylyltransferase family protein n=1 Tax=Pseudoruegeria sp. HB172150 TaxID=2721164 RepID=UPI001557CEF6|nr:NTP transferase domain-containing protein [Pseudoruegeria sp. HB172150]